MFLLHIKGGVFKPNMAVRGIGMNGRHQLTVFHLKQHFGQPGDSGGRFQMTDIRFHGPHGTIRGPFGARAEGFCQPGDFNGIPQCGSGAMGFDITDRFRIDINRLQNPGYQPGLGIGVGNRIPVGLSAMIDCTGPDHRIDGVSVCNSPG